MGTRGEEMIGLLGSHRTGKTTLAQAFAREFNIPFVRTSGSEVFAMLGKDPKVEYPIAERIAIQEAILHAFERQYAEATKRYEVWISDRTPIDLASYMLADIQRSTLVGSSGVATMVTDYVKRCLEATNRSFSTVVLVQPGIPLVEEEGKAPCCPAFIDHINALQAGLLLDQRLMVGHYMIPRRYINLQDRINAVAKAVEHATTMVEVLRKARDAAGIPLH